MNRLPDEKRIQILNLLVEGMSMRAVSRVVGVSINTVVKLLEDAGIACDNFHNENVRNLPSTLIQCDEIWSFCYAKDKKVEKGLKGNPDCAGSIWTWTALDAESRFMVSWCVSESRDTTYAEIILLDVRSRVPGRFQLTTDGLKSYEEAAHRVFGSEVDFAQLVKIEGTGEDAGRIIGSEIMPRIGNPNPLRASTSLMERHNLTTRMHQRRYTRRTNAHSKKLERHCYSLALYLVWYNFCREHSTLGTLKTPAMAVGLSDRPYGLDWLLRLVDAQIENSSN
ncbi:MAG: DDE-type integrase/transposase/recombinase [Chloroflexi bacterium]|nr:DDE-type integrase/transposase/recombinase [Chloroflexota bacterium]